MAASNSANEAPIRRRVVRRLGAGAAPARAPAVPAAAAAPAGAPPAWFEQLRPQSVFWRGRVEDLRLASASLNELLGLRQGVAEVSGTIGGLKFPAAVTTSMSAADAQTFERLTEAVVRLADGVKAGPGGGDCTSLLQLTPRSFAIVSRLTALAAQLMDRKDVSATSTLKKLDRLSRSSDALRKLLIEAELQDGLQLLERVFAPEPFARLAADRATDRSPEVYTALQERAALLLAIECRVATAAPAGETPEWPPLTTAPTRPRRSRAGAA